MSYLRVFTEREGVQEVQLSSDRTVIGRSVKSADIVIPDPKVSRIHATIHHKEGHYILRDEKSPLGTYLNEQKVGKALLSKGDTIQVGGCILEFHTEDDADLDILSAGDEATDPGVRKCLAHFHLLPDALNMRYRVLQVSPSAFRSSGDTLQLSGKGILLPTYSPLRESTMIEMKFTSPDKRQSAILAEVHAVIPYKNMQTMCLKLHRHTTTEYEQLIQTCSRGFWMVGWPLGDDNTLSDLSAL